MAHIWMRGLKLSNPSALRNLNFVQRGLPFLSKGDNTGEDAKLAEKSTNIFARKPKHGGLIQLFSTAATESTKGPQDPGINKGPPPGHDDHPRGKGTVKSGKETGSETKNPHKEREAKKQVEDADVAVA